MNIEHIDSVCRQLIKSAGETLRASFKTKLTVDTKEHRNDLVTNMDKATERYFKDSIAHHFPDHRLFGEEGDSVNDLNGIVWILDPIDGTNNFVCQQRDFAISLAIYQDGAAILGYVYDVQRDELYSARQGFGAKCNDISLPMLDQNMTLADSFVLCDYLEVKKFPNLGKGLDASRGLRFHGAAAIEFISVATGRAGAHVHAGAAPWDIAGGKLIAEEVGAIVTRADGSPVDMLKKGTILVAPPKIHQALLEQYLK